MSSKPKPIFTNIADQYGLTDLVKASNPETSKPTEPEPTNKLLDALGPSVSSFWTQNVDFFDYPAISFDEEGSASWAKIINENIFQPFLPKNRTILQHCLKVYKKEEELYRQRTSKPFLSASADPDSPARRMSCKMTGDPTSAHRIGKFLSEMSARLEKKPRPVSNRNRNAKKFALRAMKNCEAIKGKRVVLSHEEEVKGLVNHKMYNLNLSHGEIRSDGDFFNIYNADGVYESRNVDSVPVIEEKKAMKVPSIKALGAVSIMVNSGVRVDYGKQSDRMRVKGESTRKMFRRKSCCCSECGGISTLEKLTVNLVDNMNNKNEPKQEPESTPLAKVASIVLPIKEKSWRQGRTVKDGSSSSSLRQNNQLHIDLAFDERRKSYQATDRMDPRTPSRFHLVARTPSNLARTPSHLARTPSNLGEALRSMPDQSQMLKPVSTTYKISLAVPGNDSTSGKSTLLSPNETRKSILRVRTPREAEVITESTVRPVVVKISKTVSSPEQQHIRSPKLPSKSVLMRNKSDAAAGNLSTSIHSRTLLHKLNTNETLYTEEPSKVLEIAVKVKKSRNKDSEWKSNGVGFSTSPSPIRSPVLTSLNSPLSKSPKKRLAKKSRKGCVPSICNDKDINKIYTMTSEKVLPWLPPNSGLIGSPFSTLRSADRQTTLSSPMRLKPYVKAGDIISKLRATEEKYRPVMSKSKDRMATLV